MREALPIRVMVVEDFQPFRRFVCSKLEQKPELRVICEVSDGLEAVQKAEELKPDLILLDIGLPTLNGIEAARRIRELAPESKIIFSTQETSPDIVQEAMRLGAWGYVFKTHAEARSAPGYRRRPVSRYLVTRWSGVDPGPIDLFPVGFAVWVVLVGYIAIMNALLNQDRMMRSHVIIFGEPR